MKCLCLIAWIAWIASCGDNLRGNGPRDASIDVSDAHATDAATDAAPDGQQTFTDFVIDVVTNQTSSTTEPHPFSDFSTLPDPDLNNPAAYDPLFP